MLVGNSLQRSTARTCEPRKCLESKRKTVGRAFHQSGCAPGKQSKEACAGLPHFFCQNDYYMIGKSFTRLVFGVLCSCQSSPLPCYRKCESTSLSNLFQPHDYCCNVVFPTVIVGCTN